MPEESAPESAPCTADSQGQIYFVLHTQFECSEYFFYSVSIQTLSEYYQLLQLMLSPPMSMSPWKNGGGLSSVLMQIVICISCSKYFLYIALKHHVHLAQNNSTCFLRRPHIKYLILSSSIIDLICRQSRLLNFGSPRSLQSTPWFLLSSNLKKLVSSLNVEDQIPAAVKSGQVDRRY